MYEELISSLRLCRQILHEDDKCIEFVDGCCEAFPVCAYQLMEKAADAIEELRKAVLRLENELGIYDDLPIVDQSMVLSKTENTTEPPKEE